MRTPPWFDTCPRIRLGHLPADENGGAESARYTKLRRTVQPPSEIALPAEADDVVVPHQQEQAR
jgi:hypothetical protein